MEAFLVIHHLDPDEEQDEILSNLRSDGVIPDCPYTGAEDDRNAISVKLCSDDDGDPLPVLKRLSEATLKVIDEMELSKTFWVSAGPIRPSEEGSNGMLTVYDEYLNISGELLSVLAEKNIELTIHSHAWEEDV